MRLWIAIPSSITEDSRTKSESTQKVGMVARAAAIFRAEKVFVFVDPKRSKPREAEFVARILDYAATPPYLRRKLHPISEDLEKVGMLHPLGIPPHRRGPALRDGEVREAVLEVVGGRLYADAGVGRLIEYRGKGHAGSRVTVVIRERGGDYYCEPASPPENEYWGYEVKVVDSLLKLVKSSRPGSLIITSRLGKPVHEAWREIAEIVKRSPVLVAFGAPRRGLLEMYSRKTLEELGSIINFIPGQGVETVRTEEAIFSALSILNLAAMMRQ